MKPMQGIAVVLGILLVLSCDTATESPLAPGLQPQFSMNPVVESVTGSGHFHDPGASDIGWRTATFSALRRVDGSVEGTFRLIIHGRKAHYKGAVRCFTVSGNEAWIGIRLESGREIGLRVADNGEGRAASQDQISRTFWQYTTAQDYCDAMPTHPLFMLEGGNVQIHR